MHEERCLRRSRSVWLLCFRPEDLLRAFSLEAGQICFAGLLPAAMQTGGYNRNQRACELSETFLLILTVAARDFSVPFFTK